MADVESDAEQDVQIAFRFTKNISNEDFTAVMPNKKSHYQSRSRRLAEKSPNNET